MYQELRGITYYVVMWNNFWHIKRNILRCGVFQEQSSDITQTICEYLMLISKCVVQAIFSRKKCYCHALISMTSIEKIAITIYLFFYFLNILYIIFERILEKTFEIFHFISHLAILDDSNGQAKLRSRKYPIQLIRMNKKKMISTSITHPIR